MARPGGFPVTAIAAHSASAGSGSGTSLADGERPPLDLVRPAGHGRGADEHSAHATGRNPENGRQDDRARPGRRRARPRKQDVRSWPLIVLPSASCRPVSADEVNDAFRQAADGELKDVLRHSTAGRANDGRAGTSA